MSYSYIELKKARTVTPSGKASHIYVPKNLNGCEVIGLIVRGEPELSDEYKVRGYDIARHTYTTD